ncbi:MAG TPA: hypothetical protein VF622_18180 [Segetibacter sp.]|jgi:hypothetical protein
MPAIRLNNPKEKKHLSIISDPALVGKVRPAVINSADRNSGRLTKQTVFLFIVYASIIVLWLWTGNLLSGYLQLKQTLLYWIGLTIAYSWIVGIFYFVAVGIVQNNAKASKQQYEW